MFVSENKKLFIGIKGQMPECHRVAECKKPDKHLVHSLFPRKNVQKFSF